jgi:uncharacterized protein YdhG (YjbR/CyaY superfamily)
MTTNKPNDIDAYIEGFPGDIQKILRQLRATIKKSAPQAVEIISYGMPAFKFNRILVWYAAHTKHIGFYPGASGIEAFKDDLSHYKGAKGSVRFPFDQPLPFGLITEIIKFRVSENLQKTKTKQS